MANDVCRGNGALLLIMILAAWLPALPARANVILKAMATNPSEMEAREVSVRADLPKEVGPEHVVDAGGFEISFDVSKQLYYAHRTVKLGPKESRTFRIELSDVWVIDEKQIETFGRHSKKLADTLDRTEYKGVAGEVHGRIAGELDDIRKRQAASAPERVGVTEHIRAYQLNSARMQTIREDIGILENFVIGVGQDPGEILGQSSIGISLSQKQSKAGKGVARSAAWKVVLIIMGVLGAISLTFFLIWSRQVSRLRSLQEMGSQADQASAKTQA